MLIRFQYLPYRGLFYTERISDKIEFRLNAKMPFVEKIIHAYGFDKNSVCLPRKWIVFGMCSNVMLLLRASWTAKEKRISDNGRGWK